ncbi:MAG: hypothetical protein P8Q36_02940 [Alphaproteobacteria bacterium]|jgi:hypothetical protein|nr:hypothetical protein [Rhodospirillaceae bacterium]MBT6511207.1 hypothetical protein [Rhodospirillaceae bacterium]MBT7648722.1 hypothetical protein [Rhodospirillaceae bacterium]MDG2479812.1 hypothetical protein [Alphaproteobacteria bacterium]
MILLVSPAFAFAECSQDYEIDTADLAGIPHQETNRFAEPGYGVQYRFYDPDGSRNVSYYRYDNGLRAIDNEIAAAEIQGVHATVLQVAPMNGVDIVSVEQLDSFMAGDIEMLGVIYVGTRGTGSVTEFVGLGHDGQCIHKVRYPHETVTDDTQADAARAQYEAVMEDLTPHITTPLP